MQQTDFGNYKLQTVFGQTTPELEAEVTALWDRYGAVPNPQERPRRAREVYAVARDGSGTLVAVCTVFVADFGAPPAPHYHYRMFIRPADRKTGLAFAMTRATRQQLEAAYRPGDKVGGLVIVTENPMLMNPVVRAQFQQAGWESHGSDARGCDVWRKRFGAAPGG